MSKYIMRMILLTTGSMFFWGCTASTDDVENQVAAAQVAVSGKFNTTVSGSSLRTTAITDYSVYCVTLQNPPTASTATIGTDGSWTLNVPSGVSFGCFVVNSSNSPVATIIKTATTTSNFAASGETSFAVSGDLDMGTMSLDLDKGKVEVPASQFTSVESTVAATPTLDLDGMHAKSYTLSCATSGNTVMDTACAAFINESPNVYLRILKGTEGSTSVFGMGVWASATAFSGCGSIDMLDSEASAITGVTFSQNTTGSAYTADDTNCAKRESSEARSMDNLSSYYAVAPLAQTPSGWNFIQDDEYVNGSCTQTHYLSLNLAAGSTTGTMQGTFDINETYAGDCGSNTDSKQSFVVNFTEVTN